MQGTLAGCCWKSWPRLRYEAGFWFGIAKAAPRSFVMLPVVDAEDAFFADPPPALHGDEFPDSVLSDKFQVFHLAHAIFRAVAVIEVPQPVAGKLQAVAAEFAGAFGTDAQSAVDAGLGLVLFGVVASVAGVTLAQVGFTDAAVHPAGGDEVLGDPLFHFANSSEGAREAERHGGKIALKL